MKEPTDQSHQSLDFNEVTNYHHIRFSSDEREIFLKMSNCAQSLKVNSNAWSYYKIWLRNKKASILKTPICGHYHVSVALSYLFLCSSDKRGDKLNAKVEKFYSVWSGNLQFNLHTKINGHQILEYLRTKSCWLYAKGDWGKAQDNREEYRKAGS